MKTVLAIAVVVLSCSLGEVSLTRAMKQVGEIGSLRPGHLIRVGWVTVRNGYFLAGLLLMAVSFLAFLGVLSWADMSLVVPASSVGYVLSTLGARFLLGERVTATRWAGTLLVCAGVALISLH